MKTTLNWDFLPDQLVLTFQVCFPLNVARQMITDMAIRAGMVKDERRQDQTILEVPERGS